MGWLSLRGLLRLSWLVRLVNSSTASLAELTRCLRPRGLSTDLRCIGTAPFVDSVEGFEVFDADVIRVGELALLTLVPSSG